MRAEAERGNVPGTEGKLCSVNMVERKWCSPSGAMWQGVSLIKHRL